MEEVELAVEGVELLRPPLSWQLPASKLAITGGNEEQVLVLVKMSHFDFVCKVCGYLQHLFSLGIDVSHPKLSLQGALDVAPLVYLASTQPLEPTDLVEFIAFNK